MYIYLHIYSDVEHSVCHEPEPVSVLINIYICVCVCVVCGFYQSADGSALTLWKPDRVPKLVLEHRALLLIHFRVKQF